MILLWYLVLGYLATLPHLEQIRFMGSRLPHSCTQHQAFALAADRDHGLCGLSFWPSTECFIFSWSYTGSSDHVSLDVSHAGVTRTIFINLCPLGQHKHLPLLFQSHGPTQQKTANLSPCHYPRWYFTGSGSSETPLCLEIPLKKK